MSMSESDAIKTLLLTKPFTEADLKHAYQRLSKKYHPNFNPSDGADHIPDEEKFKEVNNAYHYLKEHYSFNKQAVKSEENTSSPFMDYILKKGQELEKFLMCTVDFNYPMYFKDIYNKVNELINEFYSNTNSAMTKKKINEEFNRAKTKIWEQFSLLKKKYYEVNNLNGEVIDQSEKFNYECSIGDFYSRLETIKEKYSNNQKYAKRIDEETLKYQTWSDYSKLKPLIEDCILKTKEDTAYADDDDEIEDYLVDMHALIEGYFKDHFNFLEQVRVIKHYFESINKENDRIYKRACELSQIYESDVTKLYEIKDELNDLYEEVKLRSNPNLLRTSNEIKNKFNSYINSLNLVENSEDIKLAVDIFGRIMIVIKKITTKEIPLEALRLLDRIDFNNVPAIIKILNDIASGSYTKESKSFIYLYKGKNALTFKEQYSFVYVENLNPDNRLYFFRFGYEACSKSNLLANIFNKRYVSLEDELKSATFVNKYSKGYQGIVGRFIICYTENYVFYLDGDTIKLGINDNYLKFDDKNIASPEITSKYTTVTDIISQIAKQRDEALEEYEARGSARKRKSNNL